MSTSYRIPHSPPLMSLRALLQARLGSVAMICLFWLLVAGAGALAGARPIWGLGAAIGVVYLLVVFYDLAAGVSLFLLIEFLLPNTGSSDLSVAKVMGILLLLSALARTTSLRDRPRSLFGAHPGLSLLLGALACWTLLSVGWATSRSTASSDALRYVLNLTLFFVVFAAIRTRRDVVLLLGAFALGATLSAAYGFVGGGNASQAGRLVGATGEANELGTYLVAGMFLAVALAVIARRAPLLRLVASGMAVICLVGTLLTVSRAALVALGIALFAGVALMKRYRALFACVAVVVGLAGTVYFVALAPAQSTERIFGGASGTSGRTALWTVGWRIVAADPLTGVGIGNFPIESIDYLERPGALPQDQYVVSEPLEVHNIYLQNLAEIGLVGFLLFAAIIVCSLTACWRAARAFKDGIDRDFRLLAEATFVATVAVLVANFFAPGLYDKQMWLLLALGPALLSIARAQRALGTRHDGVRAAGEPVA
jgi:O-antigen ligase